MQFDTIQKPIKFDKVPAYIKRHDWFQEMSVKQFFNITIKYKKTSNTA